MAFDRDHHFTGTQQAEYDSLHWRGRDAYDAMRWHEGATHDEAFAKALAEHGKNKLTQIAEQGETDAERLMWDRLAD